MMEASSEWSVFYTTLNRLGLHLLKNVHPALIPYIADEAEGSDAFYSYGLEECFGAWESGDHEYAVRSAFEEWCENVRRHIDDILGPFSLILPVLIQLGVTPDDIEKCRESAGDITLDLDDDKLRLFIDTIKLDLGHLPESPEILIQGIIQPYGEDKEGKLIRAMAFPWQLVVEKLVRDWDLAYQIPYEKWEEMVAAAFDRAGYDKVILTPRSGDHGRDVIAIKEGVGSIRIINSVKAYKPNHRVKHDDVRALIGVLHGDPQATKGIVTTTSSFAPGIATDPFIAPLIPYRLELMDGAQLKKWLADLALSSKNS
jgi:restriction system protein